MVEWHEDKNLQDEDIQVEWHEDKNLQDEDIQILLHKGGMKYYLTQISCENFDHYLDQ